MRQNVRFASPASGPCEQLSIVSTSSSPLTLVSPVVPPAGHLGAHANGLNPPPQLRRSVEGVSAGVGGQQNRQGRVCADRSEGGDIGLREGAGNDDDRAAADAGEGAR